MTKIQESKQHLPEALPIQQDIEGQKKLGLLVMDCYNTLNIYGKQPEQLESYNRVFQMMLGKYKFPAIKEAFIKYMESNAILPTPSDIIKLIPIERTDLVDWREEAKRREALYGAN